MTAFGRFCARKEGPCTRFGTLSTHSGPQVPVVTGKPPKGWPFLVPRSHFGVILARFDPILGPGGPNEPGRMACVPGFGSCQRILDSGSRVLGGILKYSKFIDTSGDGTANGPIFRPGPSKKDGHPGWDPVDTGPLTWSRPSTKWVHRRAAGGPWRVPGGSGDSFTFAQFRPACFRTLEKARSPQNLPWDMISLMCVHGTWILLARYFPEYYCAAPLYSQRL